jgi:hypothetical protein
VIYIEPVEWIANAVVVRLSMDRSYFVADAVAQLTAVPSSLWLLNNSVHLSGADDPWALTDNVDTNESVMRRFAATLTDKAVPFFQSAGTLEGYLRRTEARVASRMSLVGDGWGDIRLDEDLAYSHLLLGNINAMETAAEWAERAAHHDDRPFAAEANSRVQRVARAAQRSREEAIAILKDQANATKAALKIA